MREIKYRTWDKKLNKWADHDQQLSEVTVTASVRTPSILTIGSEIYELNPYTGLKDKNGKEIYEGDILKVPYNHIGNILVEYNHGLFNISQYKFGVCNVIGNKYENPELIKKAPR